MIIPFTLFSQDRYIKLLVNGRYRDIKSIHFFCIAITVFYSICGRFNDICSVFLCIFSCSRKQIYDFLGNQAYMDSHLAIFDCELSFFVICLIYMEHAAVCVKLSCVNAIFQGVLFICGYIFLISCFCILPGFRFRRITLCQYRYRTKHQGRCTYHCKKKIYVTFFHDCFSLPCDKNLPGRQSF